MDQAKIRIVLKAVTFAAMGAVFFALVTLGGEPVRRVVLLGLVALVAWACIGLAVRLGWGAPVRRLLLTSGWLFVFVGIAASLSGVGAGLWCSIQEALPSFTRHRDSAEILSYS